jgi:hypothetical protein
MSFTAITSSIRVKLVKDVSGYEKVLATQAALTNKGIANILTSFTHFYTWTQRVYGEECEECTLTSVPGSRNAPCPETVCYDQSHKVARHRLMTGSIS